MFLSTLIISNFRKLKVAELYFNRALNVIVGENNSGKTAVIDALRTALADRTVELDDLTFDPKTNSYESPVQLRVLFADLSLDDEAAFLEALVPTGVSGSYNAALTITAIKQGDLVTREITVGANKSGAAAFGILQFRRTAYLQALRDPNSSTGLRPGRQSQLANLLRRVTNEEERQKLVDDVHDANEKLKKHKSVVNARQLLEDNLQALSGPDFAQRPDLSFVQPEFQRIAGTLEAIAADMNIGMNGLGASNLYYVAAVLADLVKDTSVRYRCLMIEEPEAHLHPHYQVLLLRFLKQTAENADAPVQVFVTTHSPILASQAANDGLLPLINDGDKFVARPIVTDAGISRQAALRQYLDSTRSELFFARKILLVEGDAELLLFPSLGRLLELDLAQRGVSIVSAAGLNFKTFLPFIKGDILNVPVAIVTDKDSSIDEDEIDNNSATAKAEMSRASSPSNYYLSLVKEVDGDSRIRVFGGDTTFEKELVTPKTNRAIALDAMSSIRPIKTKRFRKVVDLENPEFPELFYNYFFGQGERTSKADFALALALILDKLEAGIFEVPAYVISSMKYLTHGNG